VTTSGTFTEYAFANGSNPQGLAVGSDGNLWVALSGTNKIAKVTTGGSITEYSIPSMSANATDVTLGPDGLIWFTEAMLLGGKLAKVTTDGAFSEYSMPGSASPSGIGAGPDGRIWNAESTPNKIVAGLGCR